MKITFDNFSQFILWIVIIVFHFSWVGPHCYHDGDILAPGQSYDIVTDSRCYTCTCSGPESGMVSCCEWVFFKKKLCHFNYLLWHHSSRTRFILPVFLSKISLKSGIHTIFSKLLRVQKGKKIYWFEFKTVMGSSDEPYTFWFFILLFYSSNKFVFCLWNMQLWTFDVWFLYQIIDLVFLTNKCTILLGFSTTFKLFNYHLPLPKSMC